MWQHILLVLLLTPFMPKAVKTARHKYLKESSSSELFLQLSLKRQINQVYNDSARLIRLERQFPIGYTGLPGLKDNSTMNKTEAQIVL